MGNWSFGQLGNSKNTSNMNKPTGRLEKRRWVEPWYLRYAILGCTMGGMFPILIPLLASKRFSSACQVGLVMAALLLSFSAIVLCWPFLIVSGTALTALLSPFGEGEGMGLFCAVLAEACVTGSALGGWLAAQWGCSTVSGMAVIFDALG
jgi:hypothetical protein